MGVVITISDNCMVNITLWYHSREPHGIHSSTVKLKISMVRIKVQLDIYIAVNKSTLNFYVNLNYVYPVHACVFCLYVIVRVRPIRFSSVMGFSK